VIFADGSRWWYKDGVETREPDLSDLTMACGLRKRLGRVDTDWVRAYTG